MAQARPPAGDRPVLPPPPWFDLARYAPLGRYTAAGWSVVVLELARLNQSGPEAAALPRITDPGRFALATAVETALGQPSEATARRLRARRAGRFVRARARLPGARRFYLVDVGQLRQVLTYLQAERTARAHLSRPPGGRKAAYRVLAAERFEDYGPGATPSAAELQAFVGHGGRVVVVDIRAPRHDLREVARQLSTSNGRGKAQVIRLDPFAYDAPYSDDDLARGETDLLEAQERCMAGWTMLAVPAGLSTHRLAAELVKLHAEAEALDRRPAEPAAVGRPRRTPGERAVVRTAHVARQARAMDLTAVTFAAWESHRIVALFDLLAWRHHLGQGRPRERDLAAWLWPERYGPAADPLAADRFDFRTDVAAARDHLARAIAVAERLRGRALGA